MAVLQELVISITRGAAPIAVHLDLCVIATDIQTAMGDLLQTEGLIQAIILAVVATQGHVDLGVLQAVAVITAIKVMTIAVVIVAAAITIVLKIIAKAIPAVLTIAIPVIVGSQADLHKITLEGKKVKVGILGIAQDSEAILINFL